MPILDGVRTYIEERGAPAEIFTANMQDIDATGDEAKWAYQRLCDAGLILTAIIFKVCEFKPATTEISDSPNQ